MRKALMVLLVPLCVGLATASNAQVPATATDAGLQGEAADLRFEDVSVEARVDGESRTWGSTWTDWDLDGDPDIFLNRHHRIPQMLRNDGGIYRSVNEDLFEPLMDRHGCAWGEANGDRLPDLYCVQGADRGKGTGPNQLLIQTPLGFEDRTEEYDAMDVLGRGRTTHWIDFDRDRDLDLFVGNTTRKAGPNVLFRNDGTRFRRVDANLPQHISTSSSAWFDWDRDGDQDVVITQHRKRNAKAFENVRGRFQRVRLNGITKKPWTSISPADFDGDGLMDVAAVNRRHITIFKGGRERFHRFYVRRLRQGRVLVWLDVDNDTDLDGFLVQGARGTHQSENPNEINHPDFFFLNNRDGFDRVRDPSFRGSRVGNADGASAADHDRDGLVDLFVTNGLFHWTGPNELLENRSVAGNWAGLDLRGPAWNPFGFGATVRVKAGKNVYHRPIGDGIAYRSESETGYVHLGLGGAAVAEVRVEWLYGTRDCVTIPSGTIRQLQIGSSPC